MAKYCKKCRLYLHDVDNGSQTISCLLYEYVYTLVSICSIIVIYIYKCEISRGI